METKKKTIKRLKGELERMLLAEMQAAFLVATKERLDITADSGADEETTTRAKGAFHSVMNEWYSDCDQAQAAIATFFRFVDKWDHRENFALESLTSVMNEWYSDCDQAQAAIATFFRFVDKWDHRENFALESLTEEFAENGREPERPFSMGRVFREKFTRHCDETGRTVDLEEPETN